MTCDILHYPCAENARITQIFGVNRLAYSRFGLNGHDGIDFGIPVKSPLYSIMDHGTVLKTQSRTTGYGRLMVVHYAAGFKVYYGHLTEFRYEQGDIVNKGDIIGYSGGAPADRYSGNSTGPHLHFEIRPDDETIRNGYGGAVDPLLYLLKRYCPPPQYSAEVLPYRGLNVRQKPNAVLGKVLYKMTQRTVVDIEKIENDGWAKIYALRDEWCSAKYLKVDTQPVVPVKTRVSESDVSTNEGNRSRVRPIEQYSTAEILDILKKRCLDL